MERENDVIELGAASVETQGPDPVPGDLILGQYEGLSDD